SCVFVRCMGSTWPGGLSPGVLAATPHPATGGRATAAVASAVLASAVVLGGHAELLVARTTVLAGVALAGADAQLAQHLVTAVVFLAGEEQAAPLGRQVEHADVAGAGHLLDGLIDTVLDGLDQLLPLLEQVALWAKALLLKVAGLALARFDVRHAQALHLLGEQDLLGVVSLAHALDLGIAV